MLSQVTHRVIHRLCSHPTLVCEAGTRNILFVQLGISYRRHPLRFDAGSQSPYFQSVDFSPAGYHYFSGLQCWPRRVPTLWRTNNEQTYLPTEQPPPCESSRIPVAHAHPRRPQHPRRPPSQGSRQAVRVVPTVHDGGARENPPRCPRRRLSRYGSTRQEDHVSTPCGVCTRPCPRRAGSIRFHRVQGGRKRGDQKPSSSTLEGGLFRGVARSDAGQRHRGTGSPCSGSGGLDYPSA